MGKKSIMDRIRKTADKMLVVKTQITDKGVQFQKNPGIGFCVLTKIRDIFAEGESKEKGDDPESRVFSFDVIHSRTINVDGLQVNHFEVGKPYVEFFNFTEDKYSGSSDRSTGKMVKFLNSEGGAVVEITLENIAIEAYTHLIGRIYRFNTTNKKKAPSENYHVNMTDLNASILSADWKEKLLEAGLPEETINSFDSETIATVKLSAQGLNTVSGDNGDDDDSSPDETEIAM